MDRLVLVGGGIAVIHQRQIGGDAFKQYKDMLRPLVEPESVIFGNTIPIKVLGYGPLPAAGEATQSDESPDSR